MCLEARDIYRTDSQKEQKQPINAVNYNFDTNCIILRTNFLKLYLITINSLMASNLISNCWYSRIKISKSQCFYYGHIQNVFFDIWLYDVWVEARPRIQTIPNRNKRESEMCLRKFLCSVSFCTFLWYRQAITIETHAVVVLPLSHYFIHFLPILLVCDFTCDRRNV